jgi:fructokinase
MDNAKQKLKPFIGKSKASVIGTGLVTLDVVIPKGLEDDPQLRGGGTCGNVLTALSYLGWQSYPIARLSNDGASKHVASDLKHWGVNLDYVTFNEDGSTPVIVQHIRNKDGIPTHSFSRKCPCCGAFMPWYKAIRAIDVEMLSPKLPKYQVYFFDRTSRGAITLAEKAREAGAVVFFEPSTSSEPGLLDEALKLAHIVKLSSDRISGNEAVLASTHPKLIIETQGSSGLRFRFSSSSGNHGNAKKWHKLDAFPATVLKDSAGAGDWCTAGIIFMLGGLGAKGLDSLTLTEVREAVKVGQAMAAWACGFVGPRGGMYRCDRATFQSHVLDLLDGREEHNSSISVVAQGSLRGQIFSCEQCRIKSSPSKQREKRQMRSNQT